MWLKKTCTGSLQGFSYREKKTQLCYVPVECYSIVNEQPTPLVRVGWRYRMHVNPIHKRLIFAMSLPIILQQLWKLIKLSAAYQPRCHLQRFHSSAQLWQSRRWFSSKTCKGKAELAIKISCTVWCKGKCKKKKTRIAKKTPAFSLQVSASTPYELHGGRCCICISLTPII